MNAIERNPELTRVLLAKRNVIARGLLESVRLYPRWRSIAEKEDVDVVIERELAIFIDYLSRAFKDGDKDYLSLYAGEKLKQKFDPDVDQNELAKIFASELAASRKVICDSVNGSVSALSLASLSDALSYVEKTLTAKCNRTLKVLWVADCIYLDIQAFLTQKMTEMGISLDVNLITTKNAASRRQEILKFVGEKQFDIMFYSPLSYELNIDFAQFQKAGAVLRNTFDKQQAVVSAIEDIRLTLQCIVENVECDVFVHNTANLVRSEDNFRDKAKLYVTSSARSSARDAVNSKIAEMVDHWNQTAFGSVRLIDERRIVDEFGEKKASQYFYKSPLQHPARLGALLAHSYADILFVEAYLKPIKVIVCDLDNTLWDGVIGEGDVVHWHDRQKILQTLKEKGILLSINSKNDIKNVHWRGALLTESDFVSSQINWDPKVQNMVRIQKELNLGLRNFLFLDDRAEEREMIKIAMPDILCLDATSQNTWRQLAVWADMSKNTGELDRTQMYKERAERESYASAEIDPDVLMAQLELTVRVREAQKQELPRVTELINRTNQFNCCDSRTTFREIQSRSKDSGWGIYIADAKDRFGEMGIVSVLVARIGNKIVDIDAFVLSCRVFGYGMETAILKKLIDDHKNLSIRGKIIKTPVNEPCHRVFKEHGFTEDGDNIWLLPPNTNIATKPWLTVTG